MMMRRPTATAKTSTCGKMSVNELSCTPWFTIAEKKTRIGIWISVICPFACGEKRGGVGGTICVNTKERDRIGWEVEGVRGGR